MTRDEWIDALKKGAHGRIYRRDDGTLRDVLELTNQGLMSNEVVQVDEQSSYLEYWWVGPTT